MARDNHMAKSEISAKGGSIYTPHNGEPAKPMAMVWGVQAAEEEGVPCTIRNSNTTCQVHCLAISSTALWSKHPQ